METSFELIDLESQDKDQLMVIYDTIRNNPVKVARQQFPKRPRGFVTVTKDLGHYACNRAVAINCRLKGEIQTAQIYETICDQIYDRLPQWARW